MDEKVTIGKLGFFRGGMAQLVRLRIKKGHNWKTRLF